MKWWEKVDDVYELHMEIGYEDTIVLEFKLEYEQLLCWFIYNSSLMECSNEFIMCDSVEDAKLELEDMFEDYLLSERDYYSYLLNLFNEEE